MNIIKQKGITLLELIAIICIVSVLSGFAGAQYQSIIASREVMKTINGFEDFFILAGHHAKISGRQVTVCGTADSNDKKCNKDVDHSDALKGSLLKWLIFEDKNLDGIVNDNERIVSKKVFTKEKVHLVWAPKKANNNKEFQGITFSPLGREGTEGKLEVYFSDKLFSKCIYLTALGSLKKCT